MPNKLTQFWQELKRRKVLRVITVYAAVAFVILQLIEIVAPSLRLPDWTINFILVVLIVGFVIAIILSWIYDIHPEEGIVKTEPVHKVKPEDIHVSSNRWKIASYISFVVIVGLIVLNIIPLAKGPKDLKLLDKSIAVLPFINDSPDIENAYFINGIMDEVLLNLQAINELRVPGRTSIEQYRTRSKPIPEIAEELGVNYIVEGSGQRYGDRIVLRVQLIEGKTDRHLWGDSYEGEINNTEDIIGLQSRIAKSIAAELKALITSEEKGLIERIPTANLTAYDFYMRGKEEYQQFLYDNTNREALMNAKDQYLKALQYDSTFARAYSGLSWVVLNEQYWETYLFETFLDSVLILADFALKYDHQLSEAYTIRGIFFRQIGNPEQAIKEFEKAKEYNPNDWMAYCYSGLIYWRVFGDNIKRIENFIQAISLHRGEELPDLLYYLGRSYLDLGFEERADHYFHEAYALDGDSGLYLGRLSWLELSLGYFEKAAEYLARADQIDSARLLQMGRPYADLRLGRPFCDAVYTMAGQNQRAYEECIELIELYKKSGMLPLNYSTNIGYAFWKVGKYEEADYYFEEAIKYAIESIRLGRDYANSKAAHYDLARIYAFRGDNKKAYQYLNEITTRKTFPLHWVTLIKNDPIFESIRDEPEFQQIVLDVEAKYQTEHERVSQWLEENDML